MYTEDQLLAQISGISSDFERRIKDGLFGLMPSIRLGVIIENTPAELKGKYFNEITEFRSICKELESIAERSLSLSESVKKSQQTVPKKVKTREDTIKQVAENVKKAVKKRKDDGHFAKKYKDLM